VNVWATATKMCGDAISSKLDSLRVRTDDPCANVEGPDRGADKAKQFLYPSEFLRFIGCGDVPLKWRLAVAVAIYLYPRDGELRVLRWTDLDLEHGTVSITKAWDRRARAEKGTKTKRVRRFNVEPALLPLLQAMREASPTAGGLVVDLPSERDMARGLKRWLKRAGVDRAELHTGSATTKGVTWHDLRATGITWMAIRGDDTAKIRERAGHERTETTDGYIRTAQAIRTGFGEVFPALPDLLGVPERPKGPPLPAAPLVHSVGPETSQVFDMLAGRTGLEPAASGVTGRRYNQLNYRPNSRTSCSLSSASTAASTTKPEPTW
jgi:hypothetical protein